MPADLDHYLHAFRTLHVNRSGGCARPHKPCMLLALAGETLMLPKEKWLWPKKEALQWRVGRLLRGE